MALSRAAPFSIVFPQSTQLHPLQNRSAAKHSQYNFKHLERLQLQGLLFAGAPVAGFLLLLLGAFSLPAEMDVDLRLEFGGDGRKYEGGPL